MNFVKYCRYLLGPALLIALFGSSPKLLAEELIGLKTSYLHSHTMHLLFATGVSGLGNEVGIDSDGIDLGWRLGVGFALTRRLHWNFYYELNSVTFSSPDPLNAGTALRSKFFVNHEVTQLLYTWDRWPVNPYVHLGLGLYNMSSVNPQTGLDFPVGLQMPFGGGFAAPLYRDTLSLNLDYTYHLLFDEEQNTGVLALLGLNEVGFDVQSLLLQIRWNLF